MASFIYNEAKRAFFAGEINLVSNDIRITLLMTNTSADTEDDVNLVSGFGTLDEYDGAGYTSGGVALASKVLNEDSANNRVEFDAADTLFAALAVGTRQAQGILLYKFITALSSSLPIAWIDTGGFPFWGNGGDVTFVWNAEGILQLA